MPAVLSGIVGARVDGVRRAPFTEAVDAYSGSSLESIHIVGAREQRLILKRVSREWDIMMRLTDDRLGRETAVWTTGLLDRLPPEMDHAYLGCARDGDGWVILMRDISGTFLPTGVGSLTAERNRQVIDAMAALHVTFWEQPEAARTEDGFCSAWRFLHFASLDTAERETVSGTPLLARIVDGWDAARSLADRGVVDQAIALANDPTILRDALAQYPQTALHGDIRAPNLAAEPSRPTTITAIDWAHASFGSPTHDLAWYVSRSPVHRTDSNETTLDAYQASVTRRLGTRFNAGWWEPMLALGYLAGLVRSACFNAWHAAYSPDAAIRDRERQELLWWANRATAGLGML